MTAKKSLAFIVIINAFNADNEGRKETTLSLWKNWGHGATLNIIDIKLTSFHSQADKFFSNFGT